MGGGHKPQLKAKTLSAFQGWEEGEWERPQTPGYLCIYKKNTAFPHTPTPPGVFWRPRTSCSPSDGRVHFVHQWHRQREGIVMQGLGTFHVATAWEERDERWSVLAPREQASLFWDRPRPVTLQGLAVHLMSPRVCFWSPSRGTVGLSSQL